VDRKDVRVCLELGGGNWKGENCLSNNWVKEGGISLCCTTCALDLCSIYY